MTDAPSGSKRYARVARALALTASVGSVAGASLAACGAPPVVPGYTVVASVQGGYCVCCPSGDWSGQCYSMPMVAPDAGGPGTPTPPPEGQRWCASADLTGATGSGGPRCPIAGPMAPPELPA
jgi:hypothetical protein